MQCLRLTPIAECVLLMVTDIGFNDFDRIFEETKVPPKKNTINLVYFNTNFFFF